jgi:hypothetical protein
MIANGGGIHVGDDSIATIDNTRIDGNTLLVDDPAGQPSGFDAGMIVGLSTLRLRNSTVSDNRVIANVAATDDNGASGSALEFAGATTIDNTRISGNSTVVTSTSGNAAALGAISAFGQEQSVMSNSAIDGNTVSASTSTGAATVQGAGVANNGLPRAPQRARHAEHRNRQGAVRVRRGCRHLERRPLQPATRSARARQHPRRAKHDHRDPADHDPGRRALHAVPGHAHKQPNRGERAGRLRRLLRRSTL